MRWLLPEFVEDILPPEAARIERLRRRLLDVFESHGYELVIPPLLEYVESLLTGTGHDLDLRTFKLVDQLSGRMMGLRADITPQVARLDAHLLNRRGLARLCYCGSVLHALPEGVSATREPLQIGAELYGHARVESDLEIQRLLCRVLEVAGVRGVRIDIGHVAIFRALIGAARIGTALEAELFAALQKKDLPELRALSRRIPPKLRASLLLLPELYGGREVIAIAARRLPKLAPIRHALSTLRRLADACPVPVSFDLAELRGYHYHSGVVFDAFGGPASGGGPVLLARGGRYDEVGRAFGRSRAATGFSMDLRVLASIADVPVRRTAILAPYAPGDAKLRTRVDALRRAGEIVIEDLPGHARTRRELGCARELVRQRGRWQIKPIRE